MLISCYTCGSQIIGYTYAPKTSSRTKTKPRNFAEEILISPAENNTSKADNKGSTADKGTRKRKKANVDSTAPIEDNGSTKKSKSTTAGNKGNANKANSKRKASELSADDQQKSPLPASSSNQNTSATSQCNLAHVSSSVTSDIIAATIKATMIQMGPSIEAASSVGSVNNDMCSKRDEELTYQKSVAQLDHQKELNKSEVEGARQDRSNKQVYFFSQPCFSFFSHYFHMLLLYIIIGHGLCRLDSKKDAANIGCSNEDYGNSKCFLKSE